MALIFVVGTGRSGTSTVAGLCHTHGVACMGHSFEGPNTGNPRGYFEDKGMMPNMMMWLASVSTPQKFEEAVEKWHGHTGSLGIKHPLLSNVNRWQWEQIAPRHIFWATRDKEQTIHSLQHWRDWKGVPTVEREVAEKTYTQRFEGLSAALDHWVGTRVTKIDFSEPRSDAWVLGKIMEGLKGESK